ncbi:hypothetical protein GCM10027089_04630 [Nocardia thraciensis]
MQSESFAYAVAAGFLVPRRSGMHERMRELSPVPVILIPPVIPRAHGAA